MQTRENTGRAKHVSQGTDLDDQNILHVSDWVRDDAVVYGLKVSKCTGCLSGAVGK
ncbi:MAG: hypothetical protein HOK57_08630 [Planctomycetaceae bacterium]|nr:hypothetical protein [Planctomycetaceae bacterium]